MDEPFAALDEFTRHKLQDELRQLTAETGCTTIFVTHSIYEAAFLAQRAVLMSPHPGRIAAEHRFTAPVPNRAHPAFAARVARLAQARRTRATSRGVKSAIAPTLSFLLALALWQIAVMAFHVPPYLVPGPAAIGRAFAGRRARPARGAVQHALCNGRGIAGRLLHGRGLGLRDGGKPLGPRGPATMGHHPAGNAGGGRGAADRGLGW